jgi:hypothetical protein
MFLSKQTIGFKTNLFLLHFDKNIFPKIHN